MKLFKRNNKSKYTFLPLSLRNNSAASGAGARWCLALAIALPLTLIIPNFILTFTERMGWWGGMANILLPLGVFGLLLTATRRTGIIALWFLPLMILSAFQIVLLFLYGESLIAVDMFLNVVTTNPQEVGELLGNLVTAIITVVVIYMPILALAIVAAFKRWRIDILVQDVFRRISALIAAVGALAMVVAYCITPNFGITRDIFPVNGLTNLGIAVERSIDMARYPVTSADWSYQAESLRPDTLAETYILVIGETTRAENWQLAGYDRETNPQLSQLDNLTLFTKALTQSNTTHKSVPMMLSSLTADNFSEINERKGIISAFNEAGFKTYYLSNQRRNHSYIDYFGEEATTSTFIKDDGREHYDHELLPLIGQAIADTTALKKLIVVHAYGSHFNYRDRYPDEFSHFRPDNKVDAKESNRATLLNAYDNTVRYFDSFLAQIDGLLKADDAAGVVIYASDHGEDIFDDPRGRFLHASPVPTYYQLHVPLLFMPNDAYTDNFPEIPQAIEGNKDKYVSPSVSIFHTLLQLAGVKALGYDETLSVASEQYESPRPMYLNDRNEAVELRESGLREYDMPFINKLLGTDW